MVEVKIYRKNSLQELSLQIKRLHIKWLADSKCLITCPERYEHVPRGTTVSREVRPCPERYDSGFRIRDSGENPQIKAQSEQCFWHSASLFGIAVNCK